MKVKINTVIINKKSLQIKEDTQREQVFTFNILNYLTLTVDTITVETNSLDDFENFNITVTHDSWLPENDGVIMHGIFDSDGGSCDDFEVYVNLEKDNNEEYIKKIEDFILAVLFGDNGLISQHKHEMDENGNSID